MHSQFESERVSVFLGCVFVAIMSSIRTSSLGNYHVKVRNYWIKSLIVSIILCGKFGNYWIESH